MEYPREHNADNEAAEIAEAEITIESDLVSLADALKTAELARDKFKSFKFEDGIASSTRLPEQLQELFDLNATLHDLELGFLRDDSKSHTDIQLSLVVEPRVGPSYFLHTVLSDGDTIESFLWPYDVSPESTRNASGTITPIMSVDEMVLLIASIAQHETLDEMSEFTRHTLSNPSQFKNYLTNPFAYQHLDAWFAPDTVQAEVTKLFELVDPTTNLPVGLELTYVNDTLAVTEVEFWQDRDKTESYSVSYSNAETETHDSFEQIASHFYDDSFYDFGTDSSSEQPTQHATFSNRLTFSHDGKATDVALTKKREMITSLQSLIAYEQIRETSLDDTI